MRNILAIAVLCLFSLSLAVAQKGSSTNKVEDEIKKLERDWAQGIMKDGAGRCSGSI